MTFPSEQEHFDAAKTALTAATARPYDYDDKIPHSVTAYNLLAVSERFGGNQRLTSQIGTRSVRVTVRSVGSSADDVREMRKRADTALRENRLTVAGFVSTPIAFETAEMVGPDGDILNAGKWLSALSSYTYTV